MPQAQTMAQRLSLSRAHRRARPSPMPTRSAVVRAVNPARATNPRITIGGPGSGTGTGGGRGWGWGRGFGYGMYGWPWSASPYAAYGGYSPYGYGYGWPYTRAVVAAPYIPRATLAIAPYGGSYGWAGWPSYWGGRSYASASV